MSDLFFFTDLDLLDGHGGGNAQSAADAFGPQSASAFRLNSKHRSNSAIAPKAYAAVKGYVLIHPIPNDSAHVNLILKPFAQPATNSSLGPPPIRFFIYRGVKKDSLVVSGSDPEVLVPGGSIDMVDKIRSTYKYSATAEAPLARFLTSGLATAPLDSSFAAISLPSIAAGMSIGRFDPAGFGFEIVLDDIGFDPDLAFASRNHDDGSVYTVTLGSGTAADNFITRAQKEFILHFLDPCAFYGNLYFAGLTAKKSDGGAITVIGRKAATRNDILTILGKFETKDRAYIDIRNENDRSYNYYGFVNDPAKKNLYSIYTDDVDVTFVNPDGAKPAPSTNYYGTFDWPILIVKNSQFSPGNAKQKNIVSIRLPRGNNDNATLFVSIGIRNDGPPAADLDAKKSSEGRSFVDLQLQPGATNYDAFDLVIPNDHTAGATTIIPTYSRLRYIRRVAAVDLFTDPADYEVQFADNIFTPLILKNKLTTSANLRISVYENEQYVDLSNVDQISRCEYIGNTGIALSANNVTLFCYPLYEQRKSDSGKAKKISQTTSPSTTASEFIEAFGKAGQAGQKKAPFTIETLTLPPAQPKIVYYNETKSLLPDFSINYSSVLMLVIDKNNFTAKILDVITDPTSNNPFSADFDVRLAIRAQSHRDQDKGNDNDTSTQPKGYSRCSLFLRGFKLANGNVDVVDVDSGIRLFSKRREDFVIHSILKDRDAVLDSISSGFLPFEYGFLVASPGVARPAVYTTYSAFDKENYLAYYSNLGDRFNNIYNEDLQDFIARLYASAGQDATSRRLYKYVFAKFIKTKQVPDSIGLLPPDLDSFVKIQLNFINGHISLGASYIHQGLFLEGANYFATWKITENLKIIQQLFTSMQFVSPGTTAQFKAKFRDRYNFIVQQYPLLNNLIESLKAEGIRSPISILDADVKDSIYVQGLRKEFSDIFWNDRTAKGVITNLRNYYQMFDKPQGPSLIDGALQAVLSGFNDTKQAYLAALSQKVYEGLGGTLREYTFHNIAIGDGGPTLGLFGTGVGADGELGGEGIFLFNYFYENDDQSSSKIKTKIAQKLDNLPIYNASDLPSAIHFGIYGINDSYAIQHKIILKKNGVPAQGADPATGNVADAFILVGEPPGSFKSNIAGMAGIGAWNNFTKDLVIEAPHTHNLTSISMDLDSKTDEESFSIVFYKTTSPVILHYAKDFENLFADDCYQLTPRKVDELWTLEERESLASIIEILKSDAVLKVDLIIGGGIGRRRVLTSFAAFNPVAVYPINTLVTYEGHLYKSLERVANSRFDAAQWILQSMVETDPDYVFVPPLSGSASDPWARTKEEKLVKPVAGSQEDIDDGHLRYSYASMIFDANTNELSISVESYASALVSNLDQPHLITVDGLPLMTGVNTNQWLCLPQSTIYKQNQNSQAYVKNAQGAMVGDAYNHLLSALRSCGLLNAILDRILLEAFDTQDGASYTLLASKVNGFKNSADVKVALTPDGPGVIKKELSLATFLHIVNNTCQ
jgi:hypothetical protein